MDKIELLIKLLKELFTKHYTGQLRLNFHEGNLSEKIEKKDSIKLIEECICGHNGITTISHIDLISPPERKE